MNTEKKSFLRHFNIYQFKFSSKLFLAFISLIILSISVISIIGFKFFKNYIEESNFESLAQICESKENYLQEKFGEFQEDFVDLTNSELANNAVYLGAGYKDLDTYEYFDSIESFKASLKEYYLDEVLNRFAENAPELEVIFPTSEKQIILQHEFIYKNPNPVGEKDRLLELGNYNSYSGAHKSLHIGFRAFAREYNLNNIYLIDNESGIVFYNLNKNIAFGTNLFTGPYKNSNLATTFQKSLARAKRELVISDYAKFIPDYNLASGYMAYPIIDNGEKSIIAIVELGPDFFEQYLFDSWMFYEDETISVNLVGEDGLLRTNDIGFNKEESELLKSLKKKGKRIPEYRLAYETQSTAYILRYPNWSESNISSQLIGENHIGKNAFIASKSITIGDLNWSIIANSEVVKSYFHLRKVRIALLLSAILLIAFTLFIVRLVAKSISRRLHALSSSITTTRKGKQIESFKSPWKDELGNTIIEFDKLKTRIDDAGTFAFELSEGKYVREFNSESKNDSLARALNTLKETLKTNKKEAEEREHNDKIQVWTNDGIAKFNDLLRQSNDNINQLSYIIIEHLIDYLNANQGGIFLVDGEDDEEKKIRLAASFAYDRKKFHTKTIEIGEGLIGNCYLEKKPIHLKKLPQDYMEVSSGLGKTNPSVLYIVPLMIDENVLGFIELASIEDIEDYKINFINKLAENIAATFSTVKLNTRTAELLEESKRRANEIAQQEEEMRQNMEEMQATQEELARIRDDDAKRSKEQEDEIQASYRMIQQLLNSFDAEVLLKDSQGVIVLANEKAALRFNSTPEKLKGKSDSDLFTSEKAAREHEIDQLVLKDGFHSEETTELVGSKDVKYFIVKKQFFLPNRQETGILTTRNKRQ